VIGAQPSQHVAVVAGGENAVKNDVVPFVEGIAHGLVDESYVGAVLDVVFAKHDATKAVLLYPGNTTTQASAEFARDAALPRSRIPPEYDEPRPITSRHHV
jgi:hypothetical protein